MDGPIGIHFWNIHSFIFGKTFKEMFYLKIYIIEVKQLKSCDHLDKFSVHIFCFGIHFIVITKE